MSFLSRQLAAAGAAAAVALGVSAGPAFARTGMSLTSTAKGKTPLAAAMGTQTGLSEINYANPSSGVDLSTYFQAKNAAAAVRVIDGMHADPAQLSAKLEWLLGADVLIRADDGLNAGESDLVYHHTTAGTRAVDAALAMYRQANSYIANADSRVGAAHRALEAEPVRLVGQDLTATEKRSYLADVSTSSLVAAIHSAAPVIQESIPSDLIDGIDNDGPFDTTFFALNEAAGDYYAVVVDRLHVDSAQRPAQAEWAQGMHTLAQGDAQLQDALAPKLGLTTARRKAVSAFSTLRRANSQIGHADALLHIHQSQPTVRLPTKISGL